MAARRSEGEDARGRRSIEAQRARADVYASSSRARHGQPTLYESRQTRTEREETKPDFELRRRRRATRVVRRLKPRQNGQMT